MGLLGNGFEDPRSSAIMALAGGLLKGDFGGGLLGANQAYAQTQEGALKRQLAQAQLEESQAQTMQRRALAQKEADALALAQSQQNVLPSLFRQPGMTGGQAVPQEIGGVPMFSLPIGAAPMRQTPGGFDVQGAIAAGFTPEQITAYAGLQNIGRPKATRQLEVDDGRGGKRIALVDDYGQEVAGLPGYIAPVQVNQGDKVTFTRPQAGVSLPVGMSPIEKDASSRGWATVNQGAQRLALDQLQGNTQILNDPNQGPILVNKRDGTSRPVTGADGRAIPSEASAKQVSGSQRALSVINEAEKLIDGATGSYLGAGVDQSARLFGLTTGGAAATAKLKALEGSLMMSQPRMEGPQSNLDVQLYRQMAGQIGDPTVPREQKKAALGTIRSLHEKYTGAPNSGASGGWGIQKVN